MEKVVDLKDLIESANKRKQTEKYRGKIQSALKVMQCASCRFRCAMCGLYREIDESSKKPASALEFAFCETCQEEFDDYLAQSKGEKRSEVLWHNKDWENMWTAWLNYRRSIFCFRNSHEFKLLLKELHTQP